jgi:sarcosine oxidase, subunit beta
MVEQEDPMSNVHADVLIIGLGVIGASIAYHSAQQGMRVIAVDRAEVAVAPAASWASAGGVRRQGRHPAEAALASEAIARWPNLAAELDADLHYRQGGQLLLAESAEEVEALRAFVDAQHAMGFHDVRLVDRAEALDLVPGLNDHVLAGSYSPADGQADPARTTRAFAQAASRHGATLQTSTEVHGLLAQGDRVVGVRTSHGSIHADAVVLAAGAWSTALAASVGVDLPVRMVAYQMLRSTAGQPGVLRPVIGALGRALSLKQLDDGGFLLGGGHPGIVAADQRSCSVRPDSQAANWRTACELLPEVEQQRLADAWCGLEALSDDEIPYIGSAGPDRLIVAFGCSGHGFAIAPAIGRAVAELLAGRPAPALAGLSPTR